MILVRNYEVYIKERSDYQDIEDMKCEEILRAAVGLAFSRSARRSARLASPSARAAASSASLSPLGGEKKTSKSTLS